MTFSKKRVIVITMKTIKTLILVTLLCSTVLSSAQTVVYVNDFSGTNKLSEWYPRLFSVNPSTGKYLGKYSGDSPAVLLSLTNLPPHKYVTVIFDMLIGRTWDGNGDGPDGLGNGTGYTPWNFDPIYNSGPDIFKFSVSGTTLIHTTFSTHDLEWARNQSYPGTYPQDNFKAGTGATLYNSLGEKWSFSEFNYYKKNITNAVFLYDVLLDFNVTTFHTNSSATFVFETFNLNGPRDEWWGLDNVIILVSDVPMYNVTDCKIQTRTKLVRKNNLLQIHVWGEAGKRVLLQSSSDLVNWKNEGRYPFPGYVRITKSVNRFLPNLFYRTIIE